MKAFRVIILLMVLCIGKANELSAALYRWIDSKGNVHYSATRPTTDVGSLEVKCRGIWRPYPCKDEEPFTVSYSSQESPKAVVSYSKQKYMIIIRVLLNRRRIERFIVDTGATYTIISPKVAKALNLEPNPRVAPIQFHTANGIVEAPLVNLDFVTVETLEVPNVMAGVHKIDEDPNIAGVIGLNYLNRFRMTVDSTHYQLILEPLRPLSEYASRNCVKAREWLAKGQALNTHSAKEAAYYKKAVSLCDDLVEAYAYLGDAYYHQEDYRQAIEQYLKVTRMLPDEPQFHYNLGVIYALAGQFFQARQEFQKTLDLDPDHKEARNGLEKLQW